MKLFQQIKEAYRHVFHPPNALSKAKDELEDARRAILVAQTHAEYYTHQVNFETGRIKRLEAYVSKKGATNG